MNTSIAHMPDNNLLNGICQVASFRLGKEWFGINVLRVQEVMNPLPRTEVPRAPNYILGLINVRGLIVTTISLKQRLSFSDLNYDSQSHMNVIVNSIEGSICLVVDEIGDVVETAASPCVDRPSTVGENVRKYIIGVLRLEDRLITLLDVDALVST